MKAGRLSAALAGLLLLAASTASALTVKLATVAPEGSPWHEALQEMVAEWQKISGGKMPCDTPK